MDIDSKPEGKTGAGAAKSLTGVLKRSKRVKDLVEEAAKDLSSANEVLKQELAELDPPAVVEDAIEKSGAAEEKVQEASDELAVVNVVLENEIRARHVLEFQYAAATEQKDAARHEALHDPLTGLPDRALFHDRLEHGLLQAKRHGWNLAVMFVDLDNFKEINDTHGHAAGDSVLQIISTRLLENTRGDDTVSRHGGDEFLYLMMETKEKEDVAATARKLIAAIQLPCPVQVGEATISQSIHASVGIALYPQHGDNAATLLLNADKAMYRAKKDGSGYAIAE